MYLVQSGQYMYLVRHEVVSNMKWVCSIPLALLDTNVQTRDMWGWYIPYVRVPWARRQTLSSVKIIKILFTEEMHHR